MRLGTSSGLLALLLACGGSSSPPLDPKLSVIQTEVFDVSCAFSACHDMRSKQKGLDLQATDHAMLLGASMERPEKVLVKPGDPDGSFLMDKLLDRDLPMAPMGEAAWTSMPPGVSLEPDRLEVVRAWIQAGALNN